MSIDGDWVHGMAFLEDQTRAIRREIYSKNTVVTEIQSHLVHEEKFSSTTIASEEARKDEAKREALCGGQRRGKRRPWS